MMSSKYYKRWKRTFLSTMLSPITLIVNVAYLFAILRSVRSADEGYGTEWLVYIDEGGTPREMNFSTLPAENRSRQYGIVYFNLYTRNNPSDPESLYIPSNGNKMESKYFNLSNDIKVVTHGWLSSGDAQWLLDIKDSYLERYDLNVIGVDWSKLADDLVYPWAACCTRYVGKRIAKLLDSLVKSYEMQGDQMHLIGHSLGAHVMGYAGMFFSDRIYRITGLDPARPLFEIPLLDTDFRLDISDAKFVDIIHTCAGVLGYENSHGMADYYPNSGKSPQPGCESAKISQDSCSHSRSYEFFIESIQFGTPFTSYLCESYEEFENGNCKDNSSFMGDPACDNSHGDYYLHTRNESKYALGDEQ